MHEYNVNIVIYYIGGENVSGTTNLNIRIDKDIKDAAEIILNELGLNMTTAINMFLRQTIRSKGIPFEFRLNEETIAAIEEGRKIAKNPNIKGYHNMEELREALEE